jgi:hypothetical protein
MKISSPEAAQQNPGIYSKDMRVKKAKSNKSVTQSKKLVTTAGVSADSNASGCLILNSGDSKWPALDEYNMKFQKS